MRRLSLTLGAVVLFLAAEFPLPSQYPPGGYPPGGYPPGRYPGGGLPPIPRRSKQKKTTNKGKENPEPLQSVTGLLRQLDEKLVIVEAQDTRILSLKRSANTKFSKNGEEIKPDVLKPGDHLLIEATQDEDGYLSAVNVILQKEGTVQERAAASAPVEMPSRTSESDDDRPVLRRKDSPPESVTESRDPAPQASVPPPAARQEPIDESDPGPPHLKRGKPAPRKNSRPQEVAAKSPPASVREPIATAPPETRPTLEPVSETVAASDPKINKARAAVADFTESLPNYVCQEQMARFVNTSHIVDWRPIDVVSAEVVYENGRERYRNLAINGKPANKRMEELKGAWSTGEFGTVLVDLFSPATAADFRYRREARSAGRNAYVYDFDVERENSHWHVEVPSQSVFPAYRGSVWIEKETGRILRIEMQAYRLPVEFPLDRVESATDYEYIRIGDRPFLLPVHAETLTCPRGTNSCSRNTIDFRNYHKYAGEATITFEK